MAGHGASLSGFLGVSSFGLSGEFTNSTADSSAKLFDQLKVSAPTRSNLTFRGTIQADSLSLQSKNSGNYWALVKKLFDRESFLDRPSASAPRSDLG